MVKGRNSGNKKQKQHPNNFYAIYKQLYVDCEDNRTRDIEGDAHTRPLKKN